MAPSLYAADVAGDQLVLFVSKKLLLTTACSLRSQRSRIRSCSTLSCIIAFCRPLLPLIFILESSKDFTRAIMSLVVVCFFCDALMCKDRMGGAGGVGPFCPLLIITDTCKISGREAWSISSCCEYSLPLFALIK